MNVPMPMIRVPFKLPSFSDFDEGDGFIYLDGEHLVIEYYILRIGIIRGEARFVKAERQVVTGLELRRGLFRDRLVVETSSIPFMREIPGKHADGITLKVWRKYRGVAERFVELANAWVDGVGPGRLRAGR